MISLFKNEQGAGETQIKRINHSLKPAQENSLKDPILKNPIKNGAGEVAQVVACLPSKCEPLSSSNTSITKKKKKNWVLGAGGSCL
jgi:hypothetical protein